jgi:hypothetical protein
MFLEGTSIFSLSQLFKYKSGDYSPNEQLEKIEDVDIRVSGFISKWMQRDDKTVMLILLHAEFGQTHDTT